MKKPVMLIALAWRRSVIIMLAENQNVAVCRAHKPCFNMYTRDVPEELYIIAKAVSHDNDIQGRCAI